MAATTSFKRLALRLGVTAVGAGAAVAIGTAAAGAASPAATDAAAETTAVVAPAATADTGPAAPTQSKPEPPTKAGSAPAADTDGHAETSPAGGPSHAVAGSDAEPEPEAAPPVAETAPPASTTALAAVDPPAPDAAPAAAGPASAPAAASAEADFACTGACGPEIRAQVGERSYDAGTGTWTVTAIADVASEIGCYVDPVCVLRVDTSGAPVAGPAPVLVCPPGWTSTADGGCWRSEGTALGWGFAATMTTTPAPPAEFDVSFVLTWEHLATALPVAVGTTTVSFAMEPTGVLDCPRWVAPGATFTCRLALQVPPGTPVQPFIDVYASTGLASYPVSITTTDPNWTCPTVLGCFTLTQPVGAWTTFVSTLQAWPGEPWPGSTGLHDLEWRAATVDGSNEYTIPVFFASLTDADVASTIALPAVLNPGRAATITATFVNSGGGPATDPLLVLAILADLESKSFTTDAPAGWTCAFGAPGTPAVDGSAVSCSAPGGSIAVGESITVNFTFILSPDYDVSVPLPVVAYSQWGGAATYNPHRFTTTVAEVSVPEPEPAPPAPDPDTTGAVLVALRSPAMASVAGLPATGADPAGLLGLGAALLAAGTVLTRRKRL